MYTYYPETNYSDSEFMELYKCNVEEMKEWTKEAERRQKEMDFKDGYVYQALCSLYRIYKAHFFGKHEEVVQEMADFELRFSHMDCLETMLGAMGKIMEKDTSQSSDLPFC